MVSFSSTCRETVSGGAQAVSIRRYDDCVGRDSAFARLRMTTVTRAAPRDAVNAELDLTCGETAQFVDTVIGAVAGRPAAV